MTDTTDTAAGAEAPRLLPVAEGAERLGQTEAWYLRQLRARQLPGRKVGRKWMLTESDISEAIERCAIAATPLPAGPFPSMSPTSRRRIARRGA